MTTVTVAAYGENEHRAAIAGGKREKSPPRAVVRASFCEESNRLVLDLQNEVHVVLPIHQIAELRDLSPGVLAAVEISPMRDGQSWRSIGVEISVPGLRSDLFGSAV